MSILRIVNPAPVVRGHYGTLWHDSQHPIGYMLTLIIAPLLLAVVVGQFLTVTWEMVGFLYRILWYSVGVIGAFSV